MNINEITPLEKSWLKLKNVEYDFENVYNDILTAYKFNSVPSNIIKSYIEIIHNKMDIFLNSGFDISDPDILKVREMYTILDNIHTKL